MRGNEARYLQECVDTNWVSYVGPFVSRFEAAFAQALRVPHAVAMNSGTAALHVALLAGGIEPDDEVLVPDLTFIAPANAVVYCRAHPVFIDVTETYWQLDVEKVARFLESECVSTVGGTMDRATGRPVRAILPVHVLGHPVEIEPLIEIANRYRLVVIEDASESLGARYRGQLLGTFGQSGCFSFNGNKIITSGGGGMLATSSSAIAERSEYLSTQARDDSLEYVHESIGYNYRLTNLQAAVGLAQLEQLDEHVRRKREIAGRYARGLADVPGLTLPQEAPWASSTFWLYTILVGEPARRTSRQLIADLAAAGVESRPLWAPLHRQRPYRHARTFQLEWSTSIYERAVSLPSSVNLTEEAQSHVVASIRRALC
jgi:perosamine synthetase